MKIFPISETIHKVDISGSFDAFKALEFAKKLDVLYAVPHIYVIIDLAAVTFMDTVALNALTHSMRSAEENGGKLYLVNVKLPVRMLLETTRMERAFSIFPTAADALADIHAES